MLATSGFVATLERVLGRLHRRRKALRTAGSVPEPSGPEPSPRRAARARRLGPGRRDDQRRLRGLLSHRSASYGPSWSLESLTSYTGSSPQQGSMSPRRRATPIPSSRTPTCSHMAGPSAWESPEYRRAGARQAPAGGPRIDLLDQRGIQSPGPGRPILPATTAPCNPLDRVPKAGRNARPDRETGVANADRRAVPGTTLQRNRSTGRRTHSVHRTRAGARRRGGQERLRGADARFTTSRAQDLAVPAHPPAGLRSP